MPKNTKGGKKFKKMKHNLEENRVLEQPEDMQEYAIVNKLLGNSRVTLSYVKDNKELVNCIGVISGRLRKKKQWVKSGNFVIISERDFEKDKVDIIHVYKEDEMNELRKRDLLHTELIKLYNNSGASTFSGKAYEDNEFSEFVEEEDFFPEDNKKKTYQLRGNNLSTQDFGIISEDDDTDVEDINDEE